MLEELDEDEHLCIKCSLTIVGLENYVRHRKTSCSKRVRPPPLNREISIDPSHSYRDLGFAELDEHHHHHHDDHQITETSHINISSPSHQSQKSSAFKTEANKSLSESYDYNDGLGADVFFSLLNLQSSSKSKQQNLAATQHTHDTGASSKVNDGKTVDPKSSSIHDEWIGTNGPPSGTESLMKVVNAISGTKKPEFVSPNAIYSYEYPHDHDSPEPPAYDDDNDEDDEIVDDDDDTAPPHTHTGGKWKPSERNTRSLATSTARWYERWDTPDDNSHLQMATPEEATEDFHPPPSHTKGKWVPGTKIIKMNYKTKERSDREKSFWCNACNRK